MKKTKDPGCSGGSKVRLDINIYFTNKTQNFNSEIITDFQKNLPGI